MTTPGSTVHGRPTFALAHSVLRSTLGICLAATFWCQLDHVHGLIGSRGLTPMAATMQQLRELLGGADVLRVPTLFWLSTADGFLQATIAAALLASVLLIVGIAPRLCCAVAYIVQVSLRTPDDGPLLWFNWPFDDLLTEVSFVLMLIAPRGLFVPPWRLVAGRPWQRWLLVWILFRLMFGTGLTKLGVGGSWTSLTGVEHFLPTQPFPTAAAMWAHELPRWCLRAATGFTLAAEVVAPPLYWWPGRPQRVAAFVGMLLMAGIWLGGSFRGFNPLTIALLLLLVDDATLLRLWPAQLRERLRAAIVRPAPPRRRDHLVAAACLLTLGLAAVGPVAAQLRGNDRDDLPLAGLRAHLRPFHLAANYFMFCVVPEHRLGLVVQGSDDGITWRDYEPHGLVAGVDRRPPRVAPGHDWLGFGLWLAAFGPPATSARWLPVLLARLQTGEPTVRALFARDPFPAAPPRFTRCALFHFAFADAEQRARGVYWQRTFVAVHTQGP